MTTPPAVITAVTTGVYTFHTPEHEADGTLTWEATTAVSVQIDAGWAQGLGWTYSSPAVAAVIHDKLIPAIRGRDPFDIAGCWSAMHRACRNIGTTGLVMQAISAVDIALWDLKARLLDVSLMTLFGAIRGSVPVYGSGGFASLTRYQLAEQVQDWAEAGCTAMKIKIGQNWGGATDRDLLRVRQLREYADSDVALMVDANGGYTVGQARRIGHQLDELGVVWFEEPVSSDDIHGLAAVRAAIRCDVAAGEYASDVYDAARLIPVLDCLQLDVTRCGGYTGWFRGAALAAATTWTSPRTAPPHCTPRSPPPSRTCGTWNGSSTTPAWNHCWSTASLP